MIWVDRAVVGTLLTDLKRGNESLIDNQSNVIALDALKSLEGTERLDAGVKDDLVTQESYELAIAV